MKSSRCSDRTASTNSFVSPERLAEDIDYTRVDLFLADGKWYFGEFTNYHNSCAPQSIEWEKLAGGLWSNADS